MTQESANSTLKRLGSFFRARHAAAVGLDYPRLQALVRNGTVERVGRTSLTIEIRAYARRGGDPDDEVLVTEARATYVAVDEQRRPRAVPAD